MDSTKTLESLGWREYPDQFRKYARCFFKRFETATRCACNDDKPGIQVCCAESEGFEGRPSYELDIVGQLPNGTWIKLHQYSLPNEVNGALAFVPQLLAMWEAACEVSAPSVPSGNDSSSAAGVSAEGERAP